MTQDEKWKLKYDEVKTFIETNHRTPSRHNPEERFKYCNWLKHNKKLLNAGEMKEDRVALFKNLLEIGDPLSVYTDPLDVPVEKLSEEAKQKCMSLQVKYMPHYMLIRGMEMGMLRPEGPVVLDGVSFDDFNSLFNHLERAMKQGIKEFEELFSNNPIEGWKLDCSDKMRFESHITDYLTE